MAVYYYRLWDYMNRHGLKAKDLYGVISSTTATKLFRNENVSVETLDKVCCYLHCKIEDICEVVEEPDKNTDL
jgi:DNA-binding Xre family transcriptional regulator